MCASSKKEILQLPLKVILTEEGVSQFIRQKKRLLRFKLADNVEESGIKFTEFTPSSLQQMMHLDYVSKLEISMPEFGSSRQEIMDLSKLIVFSVLYNFFNAGIFLFKHCIVSSCVAFSLILIIISSFFILIPTGFLMVCTS